MFASLYRIIGLMGLMSIFGALIWGWRYDPIAPVMNIYFNIALYIGWMVLHLVATRKWFKKAVFGTSGSLFERQVYIFHTLAGWGAILWFHKPMPSLGVSALDLPTYAGFSGLCLVIIGVFSFLEGKSFTDLDGFLGVPGSVVEYSHGEETPLITEGSYGKVRHPMYTGAFIAGLASILMHPNMAQFIWVGLIGATFLIFIPIEEAQLIRERGDAYKEYKLKVKWRLFRGIW